MVSTSQYLFSILVDLRKKLSTLKDLNPTDEIIKPSIVEAISNELKNSNNVKLITSELSKMQQEELISPELLTWASIETQREHRHMLETNNVDYDQLLKMCTPVQLDNDDLYHASLCSTVVNTSTDTEQCKRLLQSLSYRSLKELSVSRPNGLTTFPRCMIAISTDSSGATTCYVAFENIINFQAWKLSSDDQKSCFGKGIATYIHSSVVN